MSDAQFHRFPDAGETPDSSPHQENNSDESAAAHTTEGTAMSPPQWSVRRQGGPVDEEPSDPARNAPPPGIHLTPPELGEAESAGVRAQIEELLTHQRVEEVASTMQQLAHEPGGRRVADLAIEAGDRCAEAKHVWAATNCFLAASRADPTYERALWKLVDLCIALKDRRAAIAHMERITKLMTWRGQMEDAIEVCRRMAAIAPERKDLRETLLTAISTGRFEP